MANQAVDTIKEAANDVQDKAVELKADYDEAGGAKGLLDQASDKLSEIGDDISDAASKAADAASAKAAELKADYAEAGGAQGLFEKAKDTVVDAVKGGDEAPKA